MLRHPSVVGHAVIDDGEQGEDEGLDEPMNMSNSFQATSATGTMNTGSRAAMSTSIRCRRRRFPKSRRARVIGLVISSITLIGKKNGKGLK